MAKKFFLIIALMAFANISNSSIFAVGDDSLSQNAEEAFFKEVIKDAEKGWEKFSAAQSSVILGIKSGFNFVSDKIRGSQASSGSGVKKEDVTKNLGQQAKNNFVETKVVKDSTDNFKLYGISFNKNYLKYFGAGAVVAVVSGGIIYVLYKNGTLKTFSAATQQFLQEHKIGVASVVATTTALVLAGLYAKKRGVTFEQVRNKVTNVFMKKKSEVALPA